MVYGVGTDLCDARRVAQALQRHGLRFAQRILADGELAAWQARQLRSAERGARFVATRFAAKEALSKALGLGMRPPMVWRLAEVVSLASGQPAFALHGELLQWFAAERLQAHLSLSDEGELALAFVVVQRLPPD